MDLYIINGKGIWGDIKSHEIPATVNVYGCNELETVIVNGDPTNVVEGRFTISKAKHGVVDVSVGDVVCEPLVCSNRDGTPKVRAAGVDLRNIIPYIFEIENIKKTLERHEKQLCNDLFV